MDSLCWPCSNWKNCKSKMPNFTINFLQESEARIRGIYTCVMIPTFKTKLKHIFGACIKKILKTFLIIKFYLMPVYVFIYVTYIKDESLFLAADLSVTDKGLITWGVLFVSFKSLLAQRSCIESTTNLLFRKPDLLYLK